MEKNYYFLYLTKTISHSIIQSPHQKFQYNSVSIPVSFKRKSGQELYDEDTNYKNQHTL